jgi:hypothetical protein
MVTEPPSTKPLKAEMNERALRESSLEFLWLICCLYTHLYYHISGSAALFPHHKWILRTLSEADIPS